MTDNQIIEETLRYLSDKAYNYAILIDGEWGCGKTFFIQHGLKEQIEKSEKESGHLRKIKYISLYGCKSIQDIQENIIWGFAEEAKENLENKTRANGCVTKISGNLLLSSRKIGNAILKKFAPEANAYEIASDWLAMKSYIFVFDDIERCDCPLNEVFGFINGLVEHEGTKVILVANEKEISLNEIMSQRELQYSLALNDKILWPAKDEKYTYRAKSTENKISLEVLEERRGILFPDDDPFNVLYRQYYYHTQKWCEDKLEEVKQKFQQGKYPLSIYQKVIVLIADLIEIGFSDSYMKDVKNLMIENITKMDAPVILDNDLFFIKDKERKQKIKNIIDEINLVISAQDKQMKQKTIGEILSGEKWIEELNKYTASDNYNSFMDISIFAKADAEQWIKVIMEASIEDINRFRYWLDSYFPSNVIRENAKIDLPVIKEIIDGINTEKENDSIKKANLLWLKEQMESILELYKTT